ncbi:hypothetical protein ACN42_g2419 [Penicillium freii]|uniref:Uncharacterized protein n=1 Tax=Penicillium freii TaxID=48697 RepID=A0A117NQX6_PENFR|nr:hypothetical protein ACN42_g2419 [Penicillium freii]
MGNLNLLNWCQSTLSNSLQTIVRKSKQTLANSLACGDDSKVSFNLLCKGFSPRVQIDLTSALIFGYGASGKLRELSRALGIFCPAKSRGAHRLRHSPPQ